MEKTISVTRVGSKVKYEFDESDIREALISHFNIEIGYGKNWFLDMEIGEAVSLIVRHKKEEVDPI